MHSSVLTLYACSAASSRHFAGRPSLKGLVGTEPQYDTIHDTVSQLETEALKREVRKGTTTLAKQTTLGHAALAAIPFLGEGALIAARRSLPRSPTGRPSVPPRVGPFEIQTGVAECTKRLSHARRRAGPDGRSDSRQPWALH